MNTTNHAAQRMQQRALPELAITLLQLYGCSEPSAGDSIRYFDKTARRQVTRVVRELAGHLDRLGDMYFVESREGSVITAGHRTQPIKGDYKPKGRRLKALTDRPFHLSRKRP